MRRVISLYTGAGGLDLGFEAAGFEVAAAVEMDAEAVVTLRRNRPWAVIERNIHEVGSREILDTGLLGVGEADALIGGPPCQPFSKSGYWVNGETLRLDDPRAGTMAAYLRVLRDTLPATFFLENVPGLAYSGKSEGIELVRRTVERINRECGVFYSLSVAQVNAAHYGVPQLRERVIVVGARDGKTFAFPPPTHGEVDGSELIATVEPYATAWDAIGDLEQDDTPELKVRGKWADLLPSIPEGRNYPPPHRPRRGAAAVWLAAKVLELLAQARQGPAVLDHPGPTRARHRALPLAEPQALRPRAVPAADLPGLLPHQRRDLSGAAAARQRGPRRAGRGGGQGHAPPAPRRPGRFHAHPHPLPPPPRPAARAGRTGPGSLPPPRRHARGPPRHGKGYKAVERVAPGVSTPTNGLPLSAAPRPT